jgi:hypothetical protein
MHNSSIDSSKQSVKKLHLIDEKNFLLLKGKVSLEISVLELYF